VAIEGTDYLQAVLGSSYRLERELGRGGMATVYLAWDTKHGRYVALKVLHQALASSFGPQRFRREIGVAATLQHPHILTVLDSGESADGRLWFTMPYVEGETLRARLRREGQLGLDVVLRWGREIAGALEYAHARGIVHRDVKPENILLTEQGNAMLADFGVARTLLEGRYDSSGGEKEPGQQTMLTETGMAIGTPAYMSPEQAGGERTIDGRSDIYSLGTVLYEALVGGPPFSGPLAQAALAKYISGEAPSVRRSRPSIPEPVDSALQRALAVMPGDRYRTAGDFAQALEEAERAVLTDSAVTASRAAARWRFQRRLPIGIVVALLVVLLAGGVVFAWRSASLARAASRSAPAPVAPIRLAVLPFINVGDSEDAYFTDGLTDAVRGKLTALPGVEVIASASSAQYRGSTKSPKEIGAELGVRYLLEGKVRWAKSTGGPGKIEVNPELVDVQSGTDKWATPYYSKLTDVFQVQASIAGEVATQLGVTLGAKQQEALAIEPTSRLDAYDQFLKGENATQAGSALDPPSLRRGITFYEQAVQLDTGFALAWARLAEAHSALYTLHAPTPADARAAQAAAERASELAPGRPESQLALGTYEAYIHKDNARALEAFTKGLDVAPTNIDLLIWAARQERVLGDWDQALVHARRAEQLDPRSVQAARQLGIALQSLRRYDEARAIWEHALAISPRNLGVIEQRAMVDLAEGNLAGAHDVIGAALAVVDTSELVAYFGAYYDLFWVLTDPLQQRLLTLSPAQFDGDRGNWALVRAETYWLRGDTVHARAYADTAQSAFLYEERRAPLVDLTHMFRGLSLAYLGRKNEAILEGEKAVELRPMKTDAYYGPYNQQILARIYMLVGEPETALDHLEPLVRIPSQLSSAWLGIDPTWAPLRGNPRFQALVAAPKDGVVAVQSGRGP
jgi:eukaryotic-like serine/threonine-protein kinase